MATQFDPIAKDESLNTTEATPRNIADVLAEELRGIASALTPAQLAGLADVMISSPSDGQTLKYDAVSQKWVNANDAGGHTIENPSGTDMTQRANLQFADAHLTDDSVNDRTEVENIKDITSADYASATEDGFYNVTDESDEELTAADIAYDSNDSIKEKIDDLDVKVNRGSVSVTADGVKTYAQLLAELYALIDYSKLSLKTSVLTEGDANNENVEPMIYIDKVNERMQFAGISVFYNNEIYFHAFSFKTEYDAFTYKETKIGAGGTTVTDRSSTVYNAGRALTIYY